jgi:hypothetical protein
MERVNAHGCEKLEATVTDGSETKGKGWLIASAVSLAAAAALLLGAFFMPTIAPAARTSFEMLAGKSSAIREGSDEVDENFTANSQTQRQPRTMPFGVHDYDKALTIAIYNRMGPWQNSAELRRRPLQELAQQYPEKLLEIRAHQLRFDSSGDVAIKRDNEVSAYFGDTSIPRITNLIGPLSKTYPDKAALEAFLEEAEDGMRLDPQNGYFAMMKSMALFANYQDEEAEKLLHAAAIAPNWEDYAYREAESRWNSVKKQPGANSIAHTVVNASILFPHLARLRAMARLTDMLASRAEAAGNHSKSLQLRQDTIALGGSIRKHARTLIGALVGLAISHIGYGHTDATKYAGMDLKEWQKLDTTRRNALQLEAFDAYCKKNGKPEVAALARRESEASKVIHQIGDQLGKGNDEALDSRSLRSIVRNWTITTFTLSNALWLFTLAAAGGLVVALKAERSSAAAAAIGLLALAAILITLNARWGPDMVKLDHSLNALSSSAGNFAGEDEESSWSKLRESKVFIQGSVLVASLALPAFSLLLVGIGRLVRDPRNRASFGRGVFTVSSWLALVTCIYLFVQCATTARIDAAQNNRLDRMAHEEVQYMAERAHVKLPD